jgi:hypothetical protein
MRIATIKPIKIVGVAEIDKIVCQSSPAGRIMHATFTRKAITRDVRKADTKMAATISVVIDLIELTRRGQDSSRATIIPTTSPMREQMICFRFPT